MQQPVTWGHSDNQFEYPPVTPNFCIHICSNITPLWCQRDYIAQVVHVPSLTEVIKDQTRPQTVFFNVVWIPLQSSRRHLCLKRGCFTSNTPLWWPSDHNQSWNLFVPVQKSHFDGLKRRCTISSSIFPHSYVIITSTIRMGYFYKFFGTNFLSKEDQAY